MGWPTGRSEPRGAASAAAAAGFQRVAYLAGGIGAFSSQQNNGLVGNLAFSASQLSVTCSPHTPA